jgi:hypothetical protein
MGNTFRGRFAFVYGVLAATAAFAVAAGVYEMTKPGPPEPAQWPWTPSGTSAEKVRQIAAHVGAEYAEPGKSSKDQLAQISGGALQVEGQTIKIAKTTKVANQVEVLDGTSVQYTLCGPKQDCSFPANADFEVGPLLRREGLELALYTFRNVADVDNVVVFLPPISGEQRSRAMFFQRSELASQLDLPLSLPGGSDGISRREAGALSTRTAPYMFHFQIAPVSGADGQSQPAIVVDPEGLDGNTDQSAPTTSTPSSGSGSGSGSGGGSGSSKNSGP